MAERRMFAKTIVLSDAFLDMPLSARCLYFTLGMLADDDGFVNAPRSVMRQCGASDDDMKLLIAKKFVLIFDSGVIVIKHWRINNYLQKDRYTETKYLDEKATLEVDEKGGYHRLDSMYTQDAYTQVRLDKDSKDKVSIDQDSKGESEGENTDMIDRCAKLILSQKKNGYDIESAYRFAATLGISREKLDAYLEAGEKNGDREA